MTRYIANQTRKRIQLFSRENSGERRQKGGPPKFRTIDERDPALGNLASPNREKKNEKKREGRRDAQRKGEGGRRVPTCAWASECKCAPKIVTLGKELREKGVAGPAPGAERVELSASETLKYVEKANKKTKFSGRRNSPDFFTISDETQFSQNMATALWGGGILRKKVSKQIVRKSSDS